jgi:exportin-1
VREGFYKEYFLSLVQDLFVILTDTFHKPGFKLQAHPLFPLCMRTCVLC